MPDDKDLLRAHPASSHLCPTCQEYQCDNCQIAVLVAQLAAKDAEIERWKALVRLAAGMDVFDPIDTSGVVQVLSRALRASGPGVSRGDLCTGLTAIWCPNHGHCSCDREQGLDNSTCPLHASESSHAEL